MLQAKDSKSTGFRKFVLIPDSYKGTMGSAEICDIMREAILLHRPDAEVISIPVADGGEGSVDAFLAAMGGEKAPVTVKGPFMEDMDAFYGVVDNGATAIIEMAACAGLPLAEGRLAPDKTTTYGVGQLIAHAAKRGCKKIIVGLGGSCTNDFGAGAASALGVKFMTISGTEFIPVGGTLSQVAKIDKSGLLPELAGVEIVSMCDIDNPLYGENGAAYVFGPQKGADARMAEFLDGQLKVAAEAVKRSLDVDISNLPGAGAAGGMGGGMAAFLSSRLQMGIEIVLDTVGFDTLLQGADMVVTGEGKIDSQSLGGKVVIGVARRAKRKNVPVTAVVGDIGGDIEAAYDEGVSAIFSINRIAADFSQAKKRARSDLRLTVDNLMRFLAALGK